MTAWLAPAPLLTVIQQRLHIDISQAGTLVTLIPLISGICMFTGTFIIDRLGLRAAAVIALACMLVGSGLSHFSSAYWQILLLRIIVGIGVGLSIPLPGALTMGWFPAREQPYINSVHNLLAFIAQSTALAAPGFLLAATEDWRDVLSLLAVFALLGLAGWVIWGRDPPVDAADAKRTGHAISESGMAQALRRREVRLLAIAMIGQMWTFNTFSTFLPSFLEMGRGLTRIQAGGVSSLVPLAGVVGALICGVATGTLGRRKPFLWPLMMVALAAALIIVNVPVGLPVYVAIALLGFTSAGLSPTLMTVVMDLKGATAASTAAAFALIFGVSFFTSFFVSPAFGALVPIWGIRLSMTAFSLPLVITIIALALIPETGPKAVRSVQSVSA